MKLNEMVAEIKEILERPYVLQTKEEKTAIRKYLVQTVGYHCDDVIDEVEELLLNKNID